MNVPTMPNANRGSNTPASDEVRRTGLQPQVDSKEIHTKQKDDQDKILAIDGALSRADTEFPQGTDAENAKVNKFKKMWDQLKAKWDSIKSEEDDEDTGPTDDSLGAATGNPEYVKSMQQHPNMLPTGPGQVPTGQGTFGVT